ncbi:MAG: peptidylprolyl isomerase [Bacteroidetes bacterium]|nr:peptidylprolyl isomerase [Bacteroidota bacterium]
MRKLGRIITASIIIVASVVSNIDVKAQENGNVLDEIVAVVGKNIILHSNVQTQYLQYRMQNGITGSESEIKCSLLENLLYEKLLLHTSEVDSIEVTKNDVEQTLDMRLRYYVNQFGSEDKMAEFYKKPLEKIKTELREMIREQLLVEKTSSTITSGTVITPSEVNTFYKETLQDSIPVISPVIEYDQIVRIPIISDEVKKSVHNRLNELRTRIVNGENFSTLAILYSEDPGSAKAGGELGLTKRGSWYPEFEASAFTLEPGEISEIIETEAGYHIIQFITRRGEFVNVRHILLMVKPSTTAMAEASSFLDSIANLIKIDSMGFEEGVVRFSNDPNRINLGKVVNPNTQATTFSVEELDQAVAFVISKMEVGDISSPITHKTEDGLNAYRIIRLKSRSEPHNANLTDDYNMVQKWALQQKNDGKIKEWIKDRMSTTYIRINKEYQGCQFDNKWL